MHGPPTCLRCGREVSDAWRFAYCGKCTREAKRRKERQTPVCHVAGYVPPKGSIVWSLVGRVVQPVNGLGV